MAKYAKRKSNFVRLYYNPDKDILVRPNQAVTPSQMMKMTEQGVAVSSQLAGDFIDGEVNPAWELPVDAVRGVDIVDTWEAQLSSRNKIRTAHNSETKKYGMTNLKQVES